MKFLKTGRIDLTGYSGVGESLTNLSILFLQNSQEFLYETQIWKNIERSERSKNSKITGNKWRMI